MYYGNLHFDSIPHIGFAHHCCTEQHHTAYGKHHRGFEIAYIKSGIVKLHVDSQTFTATAGSIITIFRELPITLSSDEGQSHCTVQVNVPHTVKLVSEVDITSDGLLLPLVVSPCAETESIKKILFGIVSDIGADRERYRLTAAFDFLNILKILDTIARKNDSVNTHSSLVAYRVKRYITEHLDQPISLNDIASFLEKTPNYINRLFREANGITINQYINRERVQLIAALIGHNGLSFETACHNAGINDVTYGYRLFKKHTGLTPKQYLQSNYYD